MVDSLQFFLQQKVSDLLIFNFDMFATEMLIQLKYQELLSKRSLLLITRNIINLVESSIFSPNYLDYVRKSVFPIGLDLNLLTFYIDTYSIVRNGGCSALQPRTFLHNFDAFISSTQ